MSAFITDMNIEIASKEDGEILANLRVLVMRESLEALGRFDPTRARERFLSSFEPFKTEKVIDNDSVIAFFVLSEKPDHYYLDHLYVTPENQGKKAEKLGKHEDGEDEENGRRRRSRRTSMQDGHARS